MSVSNDQSPPARKVIPYKKGGRRQSPFSEMAFQFSGTALDVAIQQREQEVEEPPPLAPDIETQAEQTTRREPQGADGVLSETQDTQQASVAHGDTAPAVTVPDGGKTKTTLPANKSPETVEKQQPLRRVRLLPTKTERLPSRTGLHPDLQAFIDRWKPFLTDTQIGICAYIFNNSTAINQEYCFTSTAKLMDAVSKTERQVKTVLNQLMDWQFLLKGETVVNAPREKRGTYYKLNSDKFLKP